MPNNRSDFADLMAPGFRKVMFDEHNRRGDEWSQVYNMLTSKRQYEEDTQVWGFGTMPAKAEGSPIFYDEAVQGYDVRYTHNTFALGFRVTEELQDDDLYGKIAKLPKMLGLSAKQTIETNSANLFNNGFSATTGGDGQPLFSAAHPLSDGGTASNQLAVAADFSATSLKQALIEFEDTVDDRGLPLLQRATKILHPIELKWDVQEVLRSQLKPDSADNNMNPLTQAGLSSMLWHYLTDSDAWFILGDIHELNYFTRKPLTFTSGMDFDTGDAKFKANMRFSVGHTDWRGVFGTAGV